MHKQIDTASLRDLWIEPIVAKITPEENTFRLKVINQIMQTQQPYTIPEQHAKLAQDLKERNILSINEHLQIDGIYPISAKPTSKKVFLTDGRWAYALCAVDAIGFHYTFREAVRVESHCEQTKQPIVLHVDNGQVKVLEGGNHICVLHADLQNCTDWSSQCCRIMHFFATPEDLFAWRSKHITSPCHITFPVSLELANKLAWLLFGE